MTWERQPLGAKRWNRMELQSRITTTQYQQRTTELKTRQDVSSTVCSDSMFPTQKRGWRDSRPQESLSAAKCGFKQCLTHTSHLQRGPHSRLQTNCPRDWNFHSKVPGTITLGTSTGPLNEFVFDDMNLSAFVFIILVIRGPVLLHLPITMCLITWCKL